MPRASKNSSGIPFKQNKMTLSFSVANTDVYNFLSSLDNASAFVCEVVRERMVHPKSNSSFNSSEDKIFKKLEEIMHFLSTHDFNVGNAETVSRDSASLIAVGRDDEYSADLERALNMFLDDE